MSGPADSGGSVAHGYVHTPAEPGARLRLFCFHHAGGAASAFAPWRQALGPDIAVVPVQLPGREGRIREPRHLSMRALVAELNEALGPWLTEPHAFYGHSMGAAVAYALTRDRHSRGLPLPARLLVGAFPAPHLPTGLEAVGELSDDLLAQWMIDIGGMSPDLLRYPQWLHAAVSLLRADLELCADPWHTRGADPLPCPVEVFTGRADTLVTARDAAAWEQHTEAGCSVHSVPGGHFFIRDESRSFLHLLRRSLVPLAITAHPALRSLP
ncbi:thioesterase II family protein [Streptomyces sp. NPDC058221]|uniref:thioesterase II family protein n=1 Tax=Streptomyces sp. NPDC058221 TaxID=3346388 RepID=UPI0036E04A88